MNKKVILFDIDYTLFDTELFRKKLYKSILNALKVDKKVLAEVQNEIIQKVRKETGYFNPDKFSKLLAKKIRREKDASIILNAIFKKQNFKGNYYSETKKVVKQLSRIAKLGIFSKGHDRLQREKLHAFKEILDSEDVHIAVNKQIVLPDVIKKYKNYKTYIVDDALDILYAAKKLNKEIFAVWVKRGFYADKQKSIKNFHPDAIIDNLSQLVSLVK